MGVFIRGGYDESVNEGPIFDDEEEDEEEPRDWRTFTGGQMASRWDAGDDYCHPIMRATHGKEAKQIENRSSVAPPPLERLHKEKDIVTTQNYPLDQLEYSREMLPRREQTPRRYGGGIGAGWGRVPTQQQLPPHTSMYTATLNANGQQRGYRRDGVNTTAFPSLSAYANGVEPVGVGLYLTNSYISHFTCMTAAYLVIGCILLIIIAVVIAILVVAFTG